MEYGFYQVSGSTPADVEAVLPVLLQKTLERGQRAVVLVNGQERLQRLDEGLWTFEPASFLPHGTNGDQPVLLASEVSGSSDNKADVLIALGGALDAVVAEDLAQFVKVADVFDAGDAQVKRARARWKKVRDGGIEPQYFSHNGKSWQKKA